jgi:hypothetical protein
MARFPQSDTAPVDIADVLSDRKQPSPSSLRRILQHATYLAQLQRLLDNALEPALAGHFQVANTRQNRVILLAASSAWATRLRMQSAEVLAALQRAGHAEFDQIEVRVDAGVVARAAQSAAKRDGKPLSAAAEQALAQMARLGNRDKK